MDRGRGRLVELEGRGGGVAGMQSTSLEEYSGSCCEDVWCCMLDSRSVEWGGIVGMPCP